MPTFFVSYSSHNQIFIDKLDEEITSRSNRQIALWTFRRELETGDKWQERIDAKIINSDGLILVVSPYALASHYVTYEWSFALGLKEHKKDFKFIPILLENPDKDNRNHQLILVNGEKDIPVFHPKLSKDIWQYENFTDYNNYPWDKLVQTLLKVTPRLNQAIERAFEATYDSTPQVRHDAFKSLVKNNDKDGVKVALIKILDDPNHYSDIHSPAGLELAQLTNYQNENALKGLYVALIKGVSSEKSLALEAIWKYPIEKALEVSIPALSFVTDLRIGELLRKKLGTTNNPLAIDALLNDLKTQTNSSYLAIDLEALATIGDMIAIPAIIDVLASRPVTGTHLNAVKALGSFKSKTAIVPILELVDFIASGQANINNPQNIYQAGFEVLTNLESPELLAALKSGDYRYIRRVQNYSHLLHKLNQKFSTP